jgi:SAM-dependent methyltransferase
VRLAGVGVRAWRGVTGRAGRWNHNVHYHPLIVAAVPPGCQRALDVGCGEGTLARELADRIPHVSAIDADGASIELARRQDRAGLIDWICGDFLTHAFEPGSFGMITSVAALHHMDRAAGLERMRVLLEPGGALAIVGLARSRLPADLPWEAAAVITNLGYRLTRAYWEHPCPTVWPPPHSYAAVRQLAARSLPGVRYRRHILWRYSLIWRKSSA